MIQAVTTKDGKPLYIIGITIDDCRSMVFGHPIVIDLDVLAMRYDDQTAGLRGSVILLAGASQEQLDRRFQATELYKAAAEGGKLRERLVVEAPEGQ